MTAVRQDYDSIPDGRGPRMRRLQLNDAWVALAVLKVQGVHSVAGLRW